MKNASGAATAFVERLITDGKIPPRQRELATAFLDHLELYGHSIQLGSGQTVPALRAAMELLGGLDTAASSSSSFGEGAAGTLAGLAEERSNREGISYKEALLAVSKENPSLTRAWLSLR